MIYACVKCPCLYNGIRNYAGVAQSFHKRREAIREPHEHPNIANESCKRSQLIVFPAPGDIAKAPLNEVLYRDGDGLLHEEDKLAYIPPNSMEDVGFVTHAAHCKCSKKLQVGRCKAAFAKSERTGETYSRLLDYLRTTLVLSWEFAGRDMSYTANKLVVYCAVRRN